MVHINEQKTVDTALTALSHLVSVKMFEVLGIVERIINKF